MKSSATGDAATGQRVEIPANLPVLPLDDRIIFPNVVVPVMIPEGESSVRIEGIVAESSFIVLGYPRSADPGPQQEDERRFLRYGTLGKVLKMLRMKDDSLRLLIQGYGRVDMSKVRYEEGLYICRPQRVSEPGRAVGDLSALRKALLILFHEMVDINPQLSDDLRTASDSIDTSGELADFVCANIDLPLEEKRRVFNCVEPGKRAQLVIDYLVRERNLIELSRQIQSKVKTRLDRDQREYYLREQLKVIRHELGDDDSGMREIDQLQREAEQAGMSEEAMEMVSRELARLRRIPPSATEYHVSRTYLDWLINLPWSESTTDRLDIVEARSILDTDHYSLDEVKERIVEFLAVRQLKNDSRGPILCFVGPPGVGKTSLGKSIARALGRKFCRLSLGGIRDEAEIRGHRRTYIGSLPGRIIQMLRRAGTNNPVIMLDELDKIGTDGRSDPSGALLEVLDPAQNGTFSDHYLEVSFDLSRVFFIATANLAHRIPDALRDRLEVIEISGYTASEKLRIAREHLIPRQMAENGLEQPGGLRLSDEAVLEIVGRYTRESGVRDLERRIATVARKSARRLLEGQYPAEVGADDISGFLGKPRFISENGNREPELGVATALAWTPCGGEILFVEALRMKGRGGRMELTGQIGEVMRESAMAAYSYLRANRPGLDIPVEAFEDCDIHLHVPSGATPKDGPSAGVAMLTSLASLLTGRPVRHDLAMTGELTLRGRVLPVGGIKEKVLAAHRAGIRRVILPLQNEKDLDDLPPEVLDEMDFTCVDTVGRVLEESLFGTTRTEPDTAMEESQPY